MVLPNVPSVFGAINKRNGNESGVLLNFCSLSLNFMLCLWNIKMLNYLLRRCMFSANLTEMRKWAKVI